MSVKLSVPPQSTPTQEDKKKKNLKQSQARQYKTIIPGTWEAETGGSLIRGQLQEFTKTLSNLVRPCLKILKNKKF